jgi:hypothetical protein
MSNKTIFQLNNYTANQVQSNDLLYITDVAHSETKQITAGDFGKYASTVSGNYTGSFTGSLTGVLNGTASWANSASSALTASVVTNPVVFANNTGSIVSSVGFPSVGLVSTPVGTTLNFKKLVPGSSKISIASPSTDSELVVIDIASSGGTTTAGGPINSIQFNKPSGIFNGSSNLTWNDGSNVLTVVGNISATTLTTTTTNAAGFIGTASVAITSSNALTASWIKGSNVSGSVLSSSYALNSSHATVADTALAIAGISIVYKYSVWNGVNWDTIIPNTNPTYIKSKLDSWKYYTTTLNGEFDFYYPDGYCKMYGITVNKVTSGPVNIPLNFYDNWVEIWEGLSSNLTNGTYHETSFDHNLTKNFSWTSAAGIYTLYFVIYNDSPPNNPLGAVIGNWIDGVNVTYNSAP